MKKKLTSNLGLKILSLLFSVVLWLIVVNINDPVTTHPFYSVPVEIKNADSITVQGRTYEVLEGTDTVDVVVKAKRSVIDSLSKDNIKAVADMEELTFMDTVTIKLSTNKLNDKIDSITSKTENLKVSIENLQQTQLPIVCETIGEPAAGYIIGAISPDQTLVRMSGPESVISKIDKITANVDVTGMTSDISTTVDLKLYDSEGQVINNSSINKNIDSVKVNIEVLATAEVPLQFAITGEPADGYVQAGEVTGTPPTVMISGSKAAVASVTAIEIPGINIAGQTETVNVTVRVKEYLPENVNYAGTAANSKILITVPIEKITVRVIEVPKANIAITGVPENYTVEFTEEGDTIPVEVSGLAETLNALDPKTIMGSVAWSSLQNKFSTGAVAAGVYSVEAVYQLPQGVKSVSPVNVEVLLGENVITE